MNLFKSHPFVKSIACILVLTFITLDIAWAHPFDRAAVHALSAPDAFQAGMRGGRLEERPDIFTESAFVNTVLDLAKTAFVDALPEDQIDFVKNAELGTIAEGFDLSHVKIRDGVLYIPYNDGQTKYVIQVAPKDSPGAKGLIGRDLPYSDAYSARAASEALLAIRDEGLAFVMIKPDGIAAQDQMLRMLAEGGLAVVYQGEPIQFTREQAEAFYAEHKGRPFFEALVGYIMSGDLIPIIVRSEREEAVQHVRSVVGPTTGIDKSTGETAAGTIRGALMQEADRAGQPVTNRIHASDSPESVEREAAAVLGAGVLHHVVSSVVRLASRMRSSGWGAGLIVIAAVFMMQGGSYADGTSPIETAKTGLLFGSGNALFIMALVGVLFVIGWLADYEARNPPRAGPSRFEALFSYSENKLSRIIDRIAAMIPKSSAAPAGRTEAAMALFGYDERTDVVSTVPLGGGVASQFKPLLVTLRTGGKLVLRKIDKSRNRDHLVFTASLMNRLSSKGMPVPRLYPRKDSSGENASDYIAEGPDAYYMLETFLEAGEAVRTGDMTPAHYAEMGRLAARINNALAGFTPEAEKTYTPREDLARKARQAFEDFRRTIKAKDPSMVSDNERVFMDNYAFFVEQLDMFEAHYTPELRSSLCRSPIHNDLHAGNLKFDANGRIVALLDFDFAMTDYRALELNNVVLGRDTLDLELPYAQANFEAAIAGYQEVAQARLSDAEIRAAIEFLRLRFLEDVWYRFIRHHPIIPMNIFDHPDQVPYALKTIDRFKEFAAQARAFIPAVVIARDSDVAANAAASNTLQATHSSIAAYDERVIDPDSGFSYSPREEAYRIALASLEPLRVPDYSAHDIGMMRWTIDEDQRSIADILQFYVDLRQLGQIEEIEQQWLDEFERYCVECGIDITPLNTAYRRPHGGGPGMTRSILVFAAAMLAASGAFADSGMLTGGIDPWFLGMVVGFPALFIGFLAYRMVLGGYLQKQIAVFASKDAMASIGAVEKMVRVGRQAVPELCYMLSNPDPSVRKWCANTLAQIKDRRSVSYLMTLIADPVPEVRKAAAVALCNFDDPQVNALKRFLYDFRINIDTYEAFRDVAEHVMPGIAQYYEARRKFTVTYEPPVIGREAIVPAGERVRAGVEIISPARLEIVPVAKKGLFRAIWIVPVALLASSNAFAAGDAVSPGMIAGIWSALLNVAAVHPWITVGVLVPAAVGFVAGLIYPREARKLAPNEDGLSGVISGAAFVGCSIYWYVKAVSTLAHWMAENPQGHDYVIPAVVGVWAAMVPIMISVGVLMASAAITSRIFDVRSGAAADIVKKLRALGIVKYSWEIPGNVVAWAERTRREYDDFDVSYQPEQSHRGMVTEYPSVDGWYDTSAVQEVERTIIDSPEAITILPPAAPANAPFTVLCVCSYNYSRSPAVHMIVDRLIRTNGMSGSMAVESGAAMETNGWGWGLTESALVGAYESEFGESPVPIVSKSVSLEQIRRASVVVIADEKVGMMLEERFPGSLAGKTIIDLEAEREGAAFSMANIRHVVEESIWPKVLKQYAAKPQMPSAGQGTATKTFGLFLAGLLTSSIAFADASFGSPQPFPWGLAGGIAVLFIIVSILPEIPGIYRSLFRKLFPRQYYINALARYTASGERIPAGDLQLIADLAIDRSQDDAVRSGALWVIEQNLSRTQPELLDALMPELVNTIIAWQGTGRRVYPNALMLLRAIARRDESKSAACAPTTLALRAIAQNDDGPDVAVRIAAVELLGIVHDQELASVAEHVLISSKTAHGELGRRLCDALAAASGDSVPVLLRVAGNPDAYGRIQAIRALRNRADERAYPTIIESLGEQEVDALKTIAWLREMRRPDTIGMLIQGTKDPGNATRRANCAMALGRIKDEAGFSALHCLLADEDGHVRKVAVNALGAFDDARAAAWIAPLLYDTSAAHDVARIMIDREWPFSSVKDEARAYEILLSSYTGAGFSGKRFHAMRDDPGIVEFAIYLLGSSDRKTRLCGASMLRRFSDPRLAALQPYIECVIADRYVTDTEHLNDGASTDMWGAGSTAVLDYDLLTTGQVDAIIAALRNNQPIDATIMPAKYSVGQHTVMVPAGATGSWDWTYGQADVTVVVSRMSVHLKSVILFLAALLVSTGAFADNGDDSVLYYLMNQHPYGTIAAVVFMALVTGVLTVMALRRDAAAKQDTQEARNRTANSAHDTVTAALKGLTDVTPLMEFEVVRSCVEKNGSIPQVLKALDHLLPLSRRETRHKAVADYMAPEHTVDYYIHQAVSHYGLTDTEARLLELAFRSILASEKRPASVRPVTPESGFALLSGIIDYLTGRIAKRHAGILQAAWMRVEEQRQMKEWPLTAEEIFRAVRLSVPAVEVDMGAALDEFAEKFGKGKPGVPILSVEEEIVAAAAKHRIADKNGRAILRLALTGHSGISRQQAGARAGSARKTLVIFAGAMLAMTGASAEGVATHGSMETVLSVIVSFAISHPLAVMATVVPLALGIVCGIVGSRMKKDGDVLMDRLWWASAAYSAVWWGASMPYAVSATAGVIARLAYAGSMVAHPASQPETVHYVFGSIFGAYGAAVAAVVPFLVLMGTSVMIYGWLAKRAEKAGRTENIRSLTNRVMAGDMDAFEDLLKAEPPSDRFSLCAYCIDSFGPSLNPAIVARLIMIVNRADPDETDVRYRAVDLLGMTEALPAEAAKALQELERRAFDENIYGLYTRSARALDRIGWKPENPRDEIVHRLSKGDSSAVALYGDAGLEFIIDPAPTSSGSYRAHVMGLLGKIATPRAFERLRSLDEGAVHQAKIDAYLAIGRAKSAASYDALMIALRDDAIDNQHAAADALMSLDDANAQQVAKAIALLREKILAHGLLWATVDLRSLVDQAVSHICTYGDFEVGYTRRQIHEMVVGTETTGGDNRQYGVSWPKGCVALDSLTYEGWYETSVLEVDPDGYTMDQVSTPMKSVPQAVKGTLTRITYGYPAHEEIDFVLLPPAPKPAAEPPLPAWLAAQAAEGEPVAVIDTAGHTRYAAGEEADEDTGRIRERVTELFEIVESAANNRRAEMVERATRLVAGAAIDRRATTAEVKERIARVITAARDAAAVSGSDAARDEIAFLEKGMAQIDADAIVSSVIVLARKAKREGQYLVIGLETDWIPGMESRGYGSQRDLMNPIIRELETLGDTLKSMGLTNVSVIHRKAGDLAADVLAEAQRTNTALSNVVVLASNATINDASFATLKDPQDSVRPFLAGIDPTQLEAWARDNKDAGLQLDIRILELLAMTLELAAGKEPPQMPLIMSYDPAKRIVVYLPKAEAVAYEDLKTMYYARKAALTAA